MIAFFYSLNILAKWEYVCMSVRANMKGIPHQKKLYCLNLIFWIVMGCGIARLGRRGLKTT